MKNTSFTLIKRKNQLISKGNFRQAAELCFQLGEDYKQSNQNDEALTEYIEAAKWYEDCGCFTDSRDIYRLIAELLIDLDRFQEALEYGNKYLDLAIHSQNLVEKQRALCTVGRIYYLLYSANNDSCHLENAEKYYEDSFALTCCLESSLPQTEVNSMKAGYYLNMGQVQLSQGKFEDGRRKILESIDISSHEHLNEILYSCFYILSDHFLNVENFAESLKYGMKSLEIAKNKTESYGLLAKIHLVQGNYLEAKMSLERLHKLNHGRKYKKWLDDAFQLHELKCELLECQSPKRKIELEEKIADCLYDFQIFSRAAELYISASNLAEEQHYSLDDLSKLYNSAALAFDQMKDYYNALVWYQKGLDAASVPEKVIQILLDMIDVKVKQNVFDNDIRELCNKALDQAEVDEDVKKIMSVLKKVDEVLENCEDEDLRARVVNKWSEIPESVDDEKVSSESDDEAVDSMVTDFEEGEQPKKIQRPKRYIVKKKVNQKGETPLHLDCIKGDYEGVAQLINDGHPINVVDNNYWTPLHEACNYGHLEIVKLLLEHGANVNAIGSTEEESITPLYDAICNGHLSIANVLLDHGANPNILSQGTTPLDALLKWMETEGIATEDSEFASDELKCCLAQLKASTTAVSTALKKRPNQQNRTENDYGEFVVEDDIDPDLPAAETYKNAIMSVGSKRILRQKRKFEPDIDWPNKSKIPSLISENDIVDEWLEDDLAQLKSRTSKKKKLFTSTFLTGTGAHEKHKRPESVELESEDDSPVEVEPPVLEDSLSIGSEFGDDHLDNVSVGKILDEGTVCPPGVSVDIQGQCIQVPVDFSNNQLTIGWLMDEAVSRYQRLFQDKPTIALKNVRGALLCPEDCLISSVIPKEVLIGEVVSWSIDIPEPVEKQIESCKISTILDLSKCPTKPKVVIYIMKLSELHQCIQDLILDNNILSPTCCELLGSSLPLLVNMKKISLRCCGLQPKTIELLVLKLNKDCSLKLESLDASYNSIEDEGVRSLSKLILCSPRISKLSLINCCITGRNIFDANNVIQAFKGLQLQELLISYNLLEKVFLRKLLQIISNSLMHLEIAKVGSFRVNEETSSLFSLLSTSFHLTYIDISGNELDDAAIDELLVNFLDENNIEHLTLCDNKITIKSLKDILDKFPRLKVLDIRGCREALINRADVSFKKLQNLFAFVLPDMQGYWHDVWSLNDRHNSSLTKLSPYTVVFSRSM